jgi:hypothetical protein
LIGETPLRGWQEDPRPHARGTRRLPRRSSGSVVQIAGAICGLNTAILLPFERRLAAWGGGARGSRRSSDPSLSPDPLGPPIEAVRVGSQGCRRPACRIGIGPRFNAARIVRFDRRAVRVDSRRCPDPMKLRLSTSFFREAALPTSSSQRPASLRRAQTTKGRRRRRAGERHRAFRVRVHLCARRAIVRGRTTAWYFPLWRPRLDAPVRWGRPGSPRKHDR